MKRTTNEVPTPLKQGDLDRLCGVYAIINAIRQADKIEALPKTAPRLLFETAICYLSKKNILGEAIEYGLNSKRFRKVAMRLIKRANELSPATFEMTSFPDKGADLEVFFQNAFARGEPVCLRLKSRQFDHFTVVTSMSERRINLNDSLGLSWILLSSLEIEGTHRETRYKVDRKAMFAIHAERSRPACAVRFSRLWEVGELELL